MEREAWGSVFWKLVIYLFILPEKESHNYKEY